ERQQQHLAEASPPKESRQLAIRSRGVSARRAPAMLRLARAPDSPPPAPPPPAHQQLREAIEFLQCAEVTLRAGDAVFASLLLSALDRSAPPALLREERLARALVGCALDSGTSRACSVARAGAAERGSIAGVWRTAAQKKDPRALREAARSHPDPGM
ncbi:MAG TPA: hypothetical protein VG963_03455, partial [Polyangiaceae bacterium]|nr:hypothetical protein [Polyangiaceae bacterium]